MFVSRFCSKTKNYQEICKDDEVEPDPEDEDYDYAKEDDVVNEVCYKDCNSTACNSGLVVNTAVFLVSFLACFK